MILRKVVVLFAVLSPLGLFAQGCQSGGVGDPCTPEDEYQTQFSGFSPTELNVESRSFQCETRVCLVNHFRGRVSCPLGQSEKVVADVASGAIGHDDGKACRVPGSTGKSAQVIEVPVQPQCTAPDARRGRKASQAVYCSCRCDGPDANAKYCQCPSGFTCQKFTEFDLGAAVSASSGQLRGSYCIKDGTQYVPGDCPQEPSVELTQANPDACKASGNCDGVKSNPLAIARASAPGEEGPPSTSPSTG